MVSLSLLTFLDSRLCSLYRRYSCTMLYTLYLLLDWVCVLKPEVVPESGGLIRRRHDGGSERDRGWAHAEGTVRDRRLDNEQTSTSVVGHALGH